MEILLHLYIILKVKADIDIQIDELCAIANDDCVTATDLAINVGNDIQQCYVGECNDGADEDVFLPSLECGSPSGATVWYKITTDAGDGLMDVSVVSNDFGPHIQLWTDCSTAMLNCDVTSGTTATVDNIPVDGSTTYYMSVSPNGGKVKSVNVSTTSLA